MQVLQHASAHHGASPFPQVRFNVQFQRPSCKCSSMQVLTTASLPSPQVRFTVQFQRPSTCAIPPETAPDNDRAVRLCESDGV